MKGIVHFSMGVAVASFLPVAVRAGADGNPWYFVLGGAMGLLPDTIDFKVVRFFWPRDIEVQPDPLGPDPRMIAEAIAHAIDRAGSSGKPVRIRLNTARLGSDTWLQYRVFVDVRRARVCVRTGPIVGTDRRPVAGGSMECREAVAPLRFPVRLEYLAEFEVDIFDGDDLTMDPSSDGTVTVRFLPWHRAWTHGFSSAAVMGLLIGAVWNVSAGVVAAGAMTAHVLVDQLGFMGSVLMPPWHGARTEGGKRVRSDDAVVNFAAVWLSCLAVFWNVYRAMPGDTAPWALNATQLLVFGFIVPMALLLLLRRRLAL